MDPFSVATGVLAIASTLRILRGENITHSEDIVLSFTDLQKTKVLQLQHQILELAGDGHGQQPNHTDILNETLHLYAQAIRDYETLNQELLQYDPFRKPRLFPGLPKNFQPQGLAPYQDIAPFVESSFQPECKLRELDKEGRLLREKRHATLERLLLGSFGGIMLTGPMLIMVLHYDRNTAVITTCIATALFVLVLAFFAKGMAGKDVLATVAAYSAVLVVFVGTSITPQAGAQIV